MEKRITNTTELRALLASRAFSDKHQVVQGGSDRLRDSAFDFGKVLFGIVPDEDFRHELAVTLHDTVVQGEVALCKFRGIEVEHPALIRKPSDPLEAELGDEEPATVGDAAPKKKRGRKPSSTPAS